jgi:acyl-CoA thioesterase-2
VSAVPATVADLLDLLDLTPQRDTPDTFVGRQPATRLQRVFGGQVAAQALQAATATVPAHVAVHSLHSYFLRPGDPAMPIRYEVDRLRDGRSFATRRVVARQHDRPIFIATTSCQRPEPGFDHQDRMPAAPPPQDCPTITDVLARLSGRDARAFMAEWDVLDVRYVGDSRPDDGPAGGGVHDPHRPALARLWVRTAGTLPDDPAVHASVLTYTSDLSLLGAAAVPHGTFIGAPDLLFASVDHALWFHRPFRADEWLLYEQHSPSASAGLGYVTGRLFATDGTLVASVAQEGLIRQLGQR